MTKITINTPGSGGSTSPGGSNKSVQYNDSGAFGGDVLFNFDETNTRLGIGTTTPSTTLSIEGSGSSVARFESLGVGGGIDLKDQNTTADNYVIVQAIGDALQFISGGNARARLFANGNLVIGNALTDAGYKLHVEATDAQIHGVRIGRGGGGVIGNTATGFESLNSNASGTEKTAIGYQSLRASTGNKDTAVGFQAGLVTTITSGSEGHNAFFGYQSGVAHTTGNKNTFIGSLSGKLITTSTDCIAIGYDALGTAVGSNSIAIGSGSRSTSFSIVIGNATSSTGASCVAIGHGAGTANFSSSIAIGRGAAATGNNQFCIGSPTNNAGTVTLGAAAQTHYWTIKINGTDYKVLLAL
jgi:hypothetical protein